MGDTEKDLTILQYVIWSVDIDNSKARERIKEIAKMIQFAKNTALWRLAKWRTLHWRDTLNLLSKQIVENTMDSSKDPIMIIETFFSREDEEPKLKKTTKLYDNLIQASMPMKSVESTKNHIIHFEWSVSNNIAARFIVITLPPSKTSKTIFASIFASNIREEKLQANYVRWDRNIWKRS